MLEEKYLELLQFNKIKQLIHQLCFSEAAKQTTNNIQAKSSLELILPELEQTQEVLNILNVQGFFPSIAFESIVEELNYLLIDGTSLKASQILKIAKTVEGTNSLIRFIKNNKNNLKQLFNLALKLEVNKEAVDTIYKIVNEEGEVKSSASPELNRIRKNILEKKRESDKRFYSLVNTLRKNEFLRENEETFFNGRRTLAVLAENKADVNGIIHGKSESGKTIFIEPMVTVGINNEVAELEIDEQRELNKIMRELCLFLKPHAITLKDAQIFLAHVDFINAKALLAKEMNACLPELTSKFELDIKDAFHPLLYLQNKKINKKTIPLTAFLNERQRVIVISGPNAGGKTVTLKTIGLLQLMLQSGLLIPVNSSSRYSFFENILIDIGDTQSIENELSTYSAKLKSMNEILSKANEASLILMDEFGSGTDPELGSAIAETVLESIVKSKAKGIITTHFGRVKLLADKLEGCVNANMLFDLEKLEPYYKLNIGEPGSSFTFEVAEKIGFPKHLILKAKEKINKNELKLNYLIAELQGQKAKLELQQQQLDHETFVMKITKEKYHTLFNNWQEKINKERERKIELSNMADFGQKYIRLMNDWKEKKERKTVIKRFIDGITAETKKQELLKKQNLKSDFAEKKIKRLKPQLKIGSKVRVLNGSEIGEIENIKDNKVLVQMGLMKITVGIENLILVE
jgi:DNA mismatch repair protein MutS2